ncbi:MAG TPA: hydroxymethylbilane synthase [Gemmatimonadales bacterium]|nr:hydroxymethylbilane synthase [Gemmatimonadales bacterium]
MSQRSSLIRIGTRGSRLAIWQTEWVRSRLHAAGFETDRLEIKTTGDLVPDVPLAQLGSRALFTKQIDDALLDGRIDLAVHSFKDLPTQLPHGISIAAIAPREDPTDALVGRSSIVLNEVPNHGVVATSSLRRRAQLLNVRPDLHVVDVRGNVDTRIAKLEGQSGWSAIVLATAGLVRLGLHHRIGERIPPDTMLPAPGQGALALTVRTSDSRVEVAARGAAHDPVTAFAVLAERGFLGRLEGGCQVPIAAYAVVSGTGRGHALRLQGRVLSLGGERKVDGAEQGIVSVEADAEAIGVRLAERLLRNGAAEILSGMRGSVVAQVPEP